LGAADTKFSLNSLGNLFGCAVGSCVNNGCFHFNRFFDGTLMTPILLILAGFFILIAKTILSA
jgi:hypothetical protein